MSSTEICVFRWKPIVSFCGCKKKLWFQLDFRTFHQWIVRREEIMSEFSEISWILAIFTLYPWLSAFRIFWKSMKRNFIDKSVFSLFAICATDRWTLDVHFEETFASTCKIPKLQTPEKLFWIIFDSWLFHNHTHRVWRLFIVEKCLKTPLCIAPTK